MNKLYYGDCLTVMERIPQRSIDLVYLDPPFNSNRNYNAIYKDETGNPLPEQVDAFCDTWELTPEREREARAVPALMRDSGIDHDTADLWGLWMKALRKTQPSLLAYMTYMVPRLLRMYSLMKPTASLYFHCDPTASHYIKPFLDAIFDHRNYRNEISWQRATSTQKGNQYDSKGWGNNVDIILYYAKSNATKLNPYKNPADFTEEEIVEKFDRIDENGERYYDDSAHIWRTPGMGPRPNLCYEWRGFRNRHTSGWRMKKERLEEEYQKGNFVILENGKLQRRKYVKDYRGYTYGNLWTDIPMVQGDEDLGYDTQKPVRLLDRIIQASSKEGDTILDPFCGCATTLEAAHRLKRNWIGIDIAIHAIRRVAQVRLTDRCGLQEGVHYEVDGIPNSVESAEALWKQDRYQFQKWAVEQVDGFCTTKQSADGGVDGRIYFYTDEHGSDIQNMIVEVKGGKHVGVGVLRELRGVIDREDAQLGCLIVQNPPSKQQQRGYDKEIIGAGTVKLNGWEYPRLQVLSVPEILDGKLPAVPRPVGRHEPQPALLPVV